MGRWSKVFNIDVMAVLKKVLKRFLRFFGYEIARVKTAEVGGILIDGTEFGWDSFQDMRRLMESQAGLTIFDVGANLGQSASRFHNLFSLEILHCFEPSPETFQRLSANLAGHPNTELWNLGVGSRAGSLQLIENSSSDMNSFLPPGETAWGQVIGKKKVSVVTLDDFAEINGVDFIHILKSDTQGFDFEVLKGADRLLWAQKIGLVYFEFIFSKMYSNLPPFEQIFGYLSERGYLLVSFYDICYQNSTASWMDALFVSSRFKKEFLKSDNNVLFPAGKNPFSKAQA
jgi:FkbM family methyltransferase